MKRIGKMIVYMTMLVVLVSGCKKDNGTRVAVGYVLEYGSKKPVSNAHVALWEIGGDILGPVTHSRLIDSVRTDSRGYFRMEYANGPWGYIVRAKADLYDPKEVHARQSKDGSEITEIILDPHSWVRFNVKKITPPDPNDRISLGLNSSSCNIFYGGNVIDSFYVCQRVGNREFSNVYRTTIGGVLENKSIRYHTVAHDTVEVLIEW